ncbi:MAG: hypothetical protein R6U52_05270 [Kosmotogaceae bacterium]
MENTNSTIYHLIDVTKAQATVMIENGASEEDIEKLGNLMVERSEKITNGAINALESQGFVVEIYFIEVLLGNKVFYVDPIRICDD